MLQPIYLMVLLLRMFREKEARGSARRTVRSVCRTVCGVCLCWGEERPREEATRRCASRGRRTGESGKSHTYGGHLLTGTARDDRWPRRISFTRYPRPRRQGGIHTWTKDKGRMLQPIYLMVLLLRMFREKEARGSARRTVRSVCRTVCGVCLCVGRRETPRRSYERRCASRGRRTGESGTSHCY